MESTAMTLSSSYNLGLLLLAYIVACFASYSALDLAGHVTFSQEGSRKLWLIGGSVALGLGIWSMHFIAALSFMLPLKVSYHIGMTLASVVPAIVASTIALYIVSRPDLGFGSLIGGGFLMGPGIGAMHYMGVGAMRMDAKISYDPLLFALSIVVAIVVSIVALWIAFHLRDASSGSGVLQKIGAACIMGGAIVGMHMTGQVATSFTPTVAAMVSEAPMSAEGRTWMALSIGGCVALILVFVVISTLSRQGLGASPEAEAAR